MGLAQACPNKFTGLAEYIFLTLEEGLHGRLLKPNMYRALMTVDIACILLWNLIICMYACMYYLRASTSLPYMEPHVLAGHVPRLVVSI